MTTSVSIQLLRTEAHPCSYLDDRLATTEFVSPKEIVDLGLYQAINNAGFRRSGAHFYRPNCASCNACKAIRVIVARFDPSKSQQRVLQKNRDLLIEISPRADAEKYFPIYQNYIADRHQNGDMYPPDRTQFENFICTAPACTRYIEFYSNQQLIMVAVCDFLPSGLSAIYTFFEPAEQHRSLGSFAVLSQINLAKSRGLPYLYLGYWIQESSKMNYKSNFKPFELLQRGEWGTLSF